MSLIFDKDRLEKIVRSFYITMGIRVAIFDSSFREIFSAPSNSYFCTEIQRTQYGIDKCRQCGAEAFNIAKKRGDIYTHRCHAGLIEGTAPITQDGEVIAYVAFGQMLDGTPRQKQWERTKKLCGWHGDMKSLEHTFQFLQQIEREKLSASYDIMSACASYFLTKKVITTSQQTDAQKLLSFIEQNYHKKLLLDDIAKQLSISKTKLCVTAQKQLGSTVGALLTKKRIEVAKGKLESTNLPITAISALVGIEDYNYFGKKFKSMVHLSPTQYRKARQAESRH